MNTKIKFTGSFGEYFLMSLGLMVISVITLGLLFPYYTYWLQKYFFTRIEIGGKRVKFTGSFGEYFLMSLGLMVISALTLGLAFPYWVYWQIKYFFTRLEVSDEKYIQLNVNMKQEDVETKVSPETNNLFD